MRAGISYLHILLEASVLRVSVLPTLESLISVFESAENQQLLQDLFPS